MLKKIGENLSFDKSDVITPKQALSDEKIVKRFIKLAKKLKRVAPKAKDFLYGHCVMMHSAEAALINQETGEPLLNKSGEPVNGTFEKFKLDNGKDSVRWISADNIKPYKNANSDRRVVKVSASRVFSTFAHAKKYILHVVHEPRCSKTRPDSAKLSSRSINRLTRD